jgi:aminomethyltransferase
VYLNGTQVDLVRSGTVTPTVNAPIGTAYLPKEQAKPGTKFEVEIRGKRSEGEVVKLPFVPHNTKK